MNTFREVTSALSAPDEPQFQALAESESFVLGHTYEDVQLFERSTGKVHDLGSHYGDPGAGLIGPNEDWFLTGGEGLIYFDSVRGLHTFMRQEQKHQAVEAIRLDGTNAVRVLVDVYTERASVWTLHIPSLTLEFLHARPDLYDCPWQETIDF